MIEYKYVRYVAINYNFVGNYGWLLSWAFQIGSTPRQQKQQIIQTDNKWDKTKYNI